MIPNPRKIEISFLFLLFILIGIFTGCSSVGKNGGAPSFPLDVADSYPVETHSGRALLGVYHVVVDATIPSVEIIPFRESFLDMHVDIIPYLANQPCMDCLRLKALGFDSDKHLLMDFAMMHPFQDPSRRPDLNGFDLRGILVLPGDVTFPNTPPVKAVYHPKTHERLRDAETPILNPGVLVNADGYTAIFDIHPEFRPNFPKYIPGNVNPYLDYFWEDNPDPELVGNPIPWRTFAVGGGWDCKRYVLDTSKLGSTFEFDFVADVSYGQSATFQTRHNPFYRNPEFNRKEAYSVKVDVNNQLLANDPLSFADLTINVKDWQAGAPLVTDPLHPGQNEIDKPSDVRRVTIEAPSLQTGLTSIQNPDSGNGSDTNPYIFTTKVRNTNVVGNGKYPVLIAVEDQYNDNDELDMRTFQVVMLQIGTAHQIVNFNPPERITNNEHASFVWPKESIAIDSANTPHVVWTDDQSGGHQVYYSKRLSGGSWSVPENISQSTEQAYYATIAIDSLNKIHVVWEDTGGLVQGMNIRYGLKTGAGLAYNINLTGFGEGSYGRLPKIVLDTSDQPHIVWYDNSVAGGNDYDIKYVHITFPGGTPTPGSIVTIGRTLSFEGQPAITLNSSDEPRVLLVREETDYKLYYSRMSGGVFIEPTMVDAGPAYQPDIDIASTGAVVAIYHGGNLPKYQIWTTYSANDGVSWATPIQVSTSPDNDQVCPDLVMGNGGIIHIFWNDVDTSTQIPGRIHYRQFLAGDFSDEQLVTPDGYPSAFASGAVDSDGELHVALQTWIDDNYEIYYMTSRD